LILPNKNALYVGGCECDFHLIEPTIGPVTSLLAQIGYDTTVSGMFHPGGGAAYFGDYASLNASNLAASDVLVLFTTGRGHGEDIDAVLDFVRGGKGLVAIHCASDSFQDRPDFLRAVGGQFRTHPAPLTISVDIVDSRHPVTAGVPAFSVFDELYLFQNYDPADVHLLAQSTSYDDAGSGPIPIAWVREEGRGRVFYVSLGHMPAVWEHSEWRRLVQNGVQWTADAFASAS
jgi:type 1 glutamine amidotransferase